MTSSIDIYIDTSLSQEPVRGHVDMFYAWDAGGIEQCVCKEARNQFTVVCIFTQRPCPLKLVVMSSLVSNLHGWSLHTRRLSQGFNTSRSRLATTMTTGPSLLRDHDRANPGQRSYSAWWRYICPKAFVLTVSLSPHATSKVICSRTLDLDARTWRIVLL